MGVSDGQLAFRHFLLIADALSLQELGQAADRFMSYGVYPVDGRRLFQGGVWGGSLAAVDQADIAEDISHAWMHRRNGPGHPLIRDLVAQSGGNVRNRVVARLLEIALVVVEMENWVKRLQPREPFCLHASMPQEVPGALEQALVGAPVREGEVDPVAVQHIVRSLDPCMVCTVH